MGGRARLPPLGNQVLIYFMYRDEIVGIKSTADGGRGGDGCRGTSCFSRIAN